MLLNIIQFELFLLALDCIGWGLRLRVLAMGAGGRMVDNEHNLS